MKNAHQNFLNPKGVNFLSVQTASKMQRYSVSCKLRQEKAAVWEAGTR